MVRAHGSYPWGQRFKSSHRYHNLVNAAGLDIDGKVKDFLVKKEKIVYFLGGGLNGQEEV